MTPGIHCCREDDDLARAVRHMETLEVRRLPVINRGKRMVGMLALGDVGGLAPDDLLSEYVKSVSGSSLTDPIADIGSGQVRAMSALPPKADITPRHGIATSSAVCMPSNVAPTSWHVLRPQSLHLTWHKRTWLRLGANRCRHRQPGHDHTAKSMNSRTLRAAPVRMLPRVCAPAQAPEVEVLCVAEEVPQLHEEAVGHMPQPKDSDVLTPHCGQRARTVYAVPDFAVSSRGEDFRFVTSHTTCRVSRAPNRSREPLLNFGRCPQAWSLARHTPGPQSKGASRCPQRRPERQIERMIHRLFTKAIR